MPAKKIVTLDQTTGQFKRSTITLGDLGNGLIESTTEDYAATEANLGKVWMRSDLAAPAVKCIVLYDAIPGAEILIVGGGSGGCPTRGFGGGAGGYRHLTDQLLVGTTAVVVGAGGAATPTNGYNSSFGATVSLRGGDGGAGVCGSGNGGAPYSTAGIVGTDGQGNDGGDGQGPDGVQKSAGGGGGAGGDGVDAASQAGGNGGPGLQNDITGTSVYYGAGGGGGKDGAGGTAGAGGSSIGGNGQVGVGTVGQPGTANTGSGGGGGGGTYGVIGGTAGAGGSGVVIVRYLAANGTATGGTITDDGDYKVHRFTGSANFEVTSGSPTYVARTFTLV